MKSLKKVVFITILSLLLLISSVNASTGILKVTASKVRKEPNTTSDVVTTIYEDDEVEILGEDGEWYNIKYKSNTGYVKKEFLKVSDSSNNTIANTNTNTDTNTDTAPNTTNTTNATSTTTNTVNINTNEVNNNQTTGNESITISAATSIRVLPSFMSKSIISVDAGSNYKINAELNNWIQVTDGTITGWILKNKTSLGSSNPTTEPEKPEENEVNNTAATNTNTNTETNTTNTVENSVKNEVVNNTSTTNTTNTSDTNTTADNTSSDSQAGKTGKINVETARVRETASTSGEIIDSLDYGDTVNILAEEVDWYKVKSGDIEGYVSKRLVTLSNTTSRSMQESREIINVNAEDKSVVNKSQNDAVNNAFSEAAASGNGNSVVNFAKQYLGYPYVAAGKTPETGFDCSGFTRYVFLNFGVTLGGSAASQAGAGTEISRDNLQPGDLLLFYDEGMTKIGHTGIYIGDGNFVHAANPSRGVVIDNINTSSYYNSRFISARRIV